MDKSTINGDFLVMLIYQRVRWSIQDHIQDYLDVKDSVDGNFRINLATTHRQNHINDDQYPYVL